MIKYLLDNVDYRTPTPDDDHYTATLKIVFVQVDQSGAESPPFVFAHDITGAANLADLVVAYNSYRSTFSDAVLEDYANSGNAVLYAPPSS